MSPPQRATGPGGRQAPVARWGGDRPPAFFFLSRDFVANLKKKLHIGPVALWEGDRGIFLKYLKRTYIFEILFFFNIKKKKPQANVSQWHRPRQGNFIRLIVVLKAAPAYNRFTKQLKGQVT